MKNRLEFFCPDYFRNPSAWEIQDEQALIDRYSHLQLRSTRELRLDQLCLEDEPEYPVSGVAGRSN